MYTTPDRAITLINTTISFYAEKQYSLSGESLFNLTKFHEFTLQFTPYKHSQYINIYAMVSHEKYNYILILKI